MCWKTFVLVCGCCWITPGLVLSQVAVPSIEVVPGPHDGIAFRPGSRSLFRITAINQGAETGRVLVATSPKDRPGLQYARELTVPARSKRVSAHPIYLADDVAAGQETIKLETTVYLRKSSDSESLADQQLPQSTHNRFASLERERSVTGLIADPQDFAVRELVTMARHSQNLSARLTQLDVRAAPHIAERLEGFDQLVLATGELVHDPPALNALRQWVASGGRLWIMLDRVDHESVAALLGDAFGLATIDRVTITNPQLLDVRDVPRRAHGQIVRLDDNPVEMVRVLADEEMGVAFQVAGWPATIWQTVDQGRVLFTTVGPPAWSAASKDMNSDPRSPVSAPLRAIAYELFQPRDRTPVLPPAAVEIP